MDAGFVDFVFVGMAAGAIHLLVGNATVRVVFGKILMTLAAGHRGMNGFPKLGFFDEQGFFDAADLDVEVLLAMAVEAVLLDHLGGLFGSLGAEG